MVKVCIAIAILLAAGPARAAARVALAQPEAPDELIAEVATRVRAELVAAQFDVVIVRLAPGADPRDQVEAAALEPRPIATLAIVRIENRPAVDVWVYDRLTNKTLVRRLDLGKRSDPETTSALAIHAVELLRASLLETRAPSKARSDSEGTAKPVPREVGDWVERAIEPPRTLFEGRSIGIAGAVLHSFNGIGPAFAPAARIAWGDTNGFAWRVSIVGPAFGANLENARGTAFVRQELAMIECVYAPSHGWLAPLLSVGAGGYHLYASGQPRDPRDRASEGHVYAGLVDVGVGLGAHIGSGAAALLDLHAFMTQPAAHVAIGDGARDESIGPTGRPSFIASLGMSSTF
jgi:hypothetical protein